MADTGDHTTLHMLRLFLDARRLAGRVHMERLPPHQEDLGYPVHAQLAALFGEGTVQPFHVQSVVTRGGGGRWLGVLGYTGRGEDELRAHADSFAEPQDHAACDWSRFAVKTMPRDWQPGRRLGFEVRVCPVVRLGFTAEVEGKNGKTLTYKKGSEVDAWVHHRYLAGADGKGSGPPSGDSPASREEVYTAWLARRLDAAAELEGTRLTSFRRSRLVRKTHAAQRRSRVLERPDTVLQGTLRLVEPAAFHQLLEQGIGRHKAYGFGMLLLRPPNGG